MAQLFSLGSTSAWLLARHLTSFGRATRPIQKCAIGLMVRALQNCGDFVGVGLNIQFVVIMEGLCCRLGLARRHWSRIGLSRRIFGLQSLLVWRQLARCGLAGEQMFEIGHAKFQRVTTVFQPHQHSYRQ